MQDPANIRFGFIPLYGAQPEAPFEDYPQNCDSRRILNSNNNNNKPKEITTTATTTKRQNERKKDTITADVLAQHFHLPLSVASEKLGVCQTYLKQLCRLNGIESWPYRELRKKELVYKEHIVPAAAASASAAATAKPKRKASSPKNTSPSPLMIISINNNNNNNNNSLAADASFLCDSTTAEYAASYAPPPPPRSPGAFGGGSGFAPSTPDASPLSPLSTVTLTIRQPTYYTNIAPYAGGANSSTTTASTSASANAELGVASFYGPSACTSSPQATATRSRKQGGLPSIRDLVNDINEMPPTETQSQQMFITSFPSQDDGDDNNNNNNNNNGGSGSSTVITNLAPQLRLYPVDSTTTTTITTVPPTLLIHDETAPWGPSAGLPPAPPPAPTRPRIVEARRASIGTIYEYVPKVPSLKKRVRSGSEDVTATGGQQQASPPLTSAFNHSNSSAFKRSRRDSEGLFNS